MRSGFARLHPLVDLTFFVLVLAFAMFLSHPAVQLAGLVCAALFALRCTGRGFGRRRWSGTVPREHFLLRRPPSGPYHRQRRYCCCR